MLEHFYQAHTAPGTIIYSDEWAEYRHVKGHPGVAYHGTVNHSLNFINPTTGTHTQNVESYWNKVNGKKKLMKGCYSEQLAI